MSTQLKETMPPGYFDTLSAFNQPYKIEQEMSEVTKIRQDLN
jgi:hypothetical protein